MSTWKYLLKSLYSNQAIIDGRKKPWYWAVIFYILSIFLMVVVPLATGYENDGTSVIKASNDNGVQNSLFRLSQDESFKGLYIENGTLKDSSDKNDGKTFATQGNSFYDGTSLDNIVPVTPSDSNTQVDITLPKDEKYNFTMNITTSDNKPAQVSQLRVFSTSIDPINDENGQKKLADLLNKTIFRTDIENSSQRPISRSFIVFTPSEFVLYTYAPLQSSAPSGSTDPVASNSSKGTVFTGTFTNFKERYDFGTNLGIASGTKFEIDGSEFLDKWSPFITKSYIPLRDKSIWINFGITAGGSAIAILIAGLVIWLFTLSRKNLLHKDCTLWQGLKMGATLSFTVALLGMILYFIASSYAVMFAAMGLVMRTMWLIMKTMGGGRNAQQDKPLYQAR